MLILEYTQGEGFKEIEVEEDDGGSFESWISKNGFDASYEESDGVSCVRGKNDYETAIRHFYPRGETSADRRRVTMIAGTCRGELILTRNCADFMALRALLAPLAVAQTLDELMRELGNHGFIGNDARER